MPNNKTILKKLFYGEINPSENIASGNSEYKKTEKTLNEMKHKFMKSLSDSEVMNFREIMELQNQNTGLYGYESFVYGFKLATGLMFEALPNSDKTNLAVKLAEENSETNEI